MELMMKSLFVVAVILFVENSQVWADNIDSSCSWRYRKQNGTSGVITSPNYPGNYGDNLECFWEIDIPQNMVSRISFDPIFELELNTASGHCRDKVSIYNDPNYVYCGKTAPPTRYYSGRVVIQFTSDRSSSYKGFRLHWKFVKVDSCSKTPIIQNGRSGVITSPNHPNSYYRRLDCRWLIAVPGNTMVEISFDSKFHVEFRTYSGCPDALTIKSKTAENGDVYCGSIAPLTRVYSGRVIIRFTSDDSVSYKGFKLVWRFLKVDSTCSETPRVQNGASGVISSPNFPGNYNHHLNCVWLIKTPKNTGVEISFDPRFRVDSGSPLNIFVNGIYIASYRGSTAPPTRYYSGSVKIMFNTGSSRTYTGFKLHWTILKVDSTCSRQSRVQIGRTGVITSPNYPGNYGDNLHCRWLIRTPQNMKVEISFDPIFEVDSNTTSDTHNCRDKLYIIYTDYSTGNGDVYCGSTAPPTRYYSGDVIIKFKSDSSNSYKGFKLFWRFLKVDSCSKTPIIQNGRSGVLSSPNYPGNYYHGLNCSWAIVAPENTVVELSFDSNFSIEPKSYGRCWDVLTIQSETVNVYCGNTAPPTRNYTGRVIIRFTSGSYGSYSGFKLLWWFVKVDSCSKTPIIQNGRSGVLSSPNYPNKYYRRLDCRWLIAVPGNTIVEISFDSNFSIGAKTGDSCRDALTIKSKTAENGDVYCGNTAPPTRYYSGEVAIQFTSDRSSTYHKGFELHWKFVKVDSCSKTPIIQNGRSGVLSSPNYPNKYYRRLDCRWLIAVPGNTIVEISFDSNFGIGAKTGDNCFDALTIKSETDRDVYCGNTAPPTRNYTSEVDIRFTSDRSSTYHKGFELCWKFVKVDSCSKTPIIQNGRSGVISSPNYPNSYNDNIDCSWLIQAPENTMVEISFESNFHIQTSKGRCWDALTIKSETGYNLYCGSAAPGNRSHTGNITIQFTSDNSRSNAGFKLLWRVKDTDTDTDTDTDRISYLTVVFGIGFLILVIVAAIAIAVLIRQRRNVRNRNTGNNTTDPGAMCYQPSSSGVGGRIYTTQDGIYEDIDDGEIYDDVDIVDVVVAGVRNVTDDDVDVRNATDDDVDAWNSTDDDVDVWNSDDDVDDNLVAGVRNPPEDTYIVAGVRNPLEDDYVGPDVMNPPEDTYIVAGVRNPPEDDYVVVAGVRNTPEDTYIVPDARNSSEDTYVVAGVRNSAEDDYVVVPNIRNTPEDTYVVAGVSNPTEDTYIVAGVRNPPEDDYVGPDDMNPPEDTYIFTGVRNPPEDTYIVALKPTTTSADDRISPEDDYVGPDVRYSTEDTYVVAGVRNPPEDTYIVPDARNSTEDDYVVVAGVRNPPEDDYVVVAGVRNTPEDTYIVPDARNSSEDDYVVVAGVRNPPEDTYVVPDIRNPPEDTYVVADGIRPQLDDNGTMD
ncbi:cubilin-like [Tubulanus polymorphus]|uniref:cubilin-like n=1 Tax=Tubulanus polymorphus TaxID=672921 RepID=UPI003DA20F73